MASYGEGGKVTARNIYTNDFFTSKSMPEQTPIDKRISHRFSQLKTTEQLKLSQLRGNQLGS